ncbi:MAG: fibronectin type III domain-containing protein [Bacteroidia bacterium]|nr:fibronectin type III domain-containing protein [Bacteroidia bacterium]MDW8157533.1 fibronectin type III domain-containing protein [Bacteroidia bacterium]
MRQKFLTLLFFTLLSCSLWGQNCTPPTNLALVTRDATSATFSWSAQSGIIGYEVSWRDVNASTWQVGYTTSPIFAITNLVPGTVYEVRVRTECQRGGVYSSYTNPVMFATQSSGNNRCEMPSNFNFSQITSSSVTLSWQPVNGAVGYELSYRIINGTWSTITTTSTSYTLSGLNPSTTYEVQVRAQCPNNQVSTPTKPLQFSTQAASSNENCGTPTGLRAYNATESSITLNWVPSSGDVWFYEIQYRRADSDFWFLAFTTSTTRVLNFLQPSTNYEVRVRAICGLNSFSSFTPIVSFSTTERSSTCEVPQNIRIREVDNLLVTIEWDGVSSNYWLYEVQYRRRGSDFWIPFFAFSNRATLLLWSRNEDFEVRIRTICNFGFNSEWSNITTVSTNSVNPNCSVPASVSVNNVTRNSAVVSWSPVSGANEYTIRYRLAGNWWWWYESTSGTSFSIGGLQPLRTYEWQVQARCGSNGNSSWTPLNLFATLSGRMGELESSTQPISLSIFPNPNNGYFVASYFANASGEVNLTITDLNGRLLLKDIFVVEPGINEIPIRLTHVQRGIYILQAEQNGYITYQKLIVE